MNKLETNNKIKNDIKIINSMNIEADQKLDRISFTGFSNYDLYTPIYEIKESMGFRITTEHMSDIKFLDDFIGRVYDIRKYDGWYNKSLKRAYLITKNIRSLGNPYAKTQSINSKLIKVITNQDINNFVNQIFQIIEAQ